MNEKDLVMLNEIKEALRNFIVRVALCSNETVFAYEVQVLPDVIKEFRDVVKLSNGFL